MIDLLFDDKFDFGKKIDKNPEEFIKKCCEAVLIAENYVESVEISVTFTDNDEIQNLNRQYRKKDKITDVLSFPMNEVNPENGYVVLGDIVINTEQAEKQANEYGHGIERELAFLTVHSMLHLLGYEHENDPCGDKIMRKKQTEILEKLNLRVEG